MKVVLPRFESRPARRGERIAAVGILLMIVVACVVLTQRHPSGMSVVPNCPTNAVLGIDCPGCGSLRAVHHLLNWRFAEAWRHNQMLIALGLPAIGLLLVDLLSTLAVGRRAIMPFGRGVGYALAFILVAWLVARNLPIDACAGLRPPAEAEATAPAEARSEAVLVRRPESRPR